MVDMINLVSSDKKHKQIYDEKSKLTTTKSVSGKLILK